MGPENDEAIHDAAVSARMLGCAWGGNAFARKRAAEVLEDLYSVLGENHIRCLGTTQGGSPLHPLRLARGLSPRVFSR